MFEKINEKIPNNSPSDICNAIQNKQDHEKEYVILKNYFKSKKYSAERKESSPSKETTIASDIVMNGNDTISSANDLEKRSDKQTNKQPFYYDALKEVPRQAAVPIYEAQSIIDTPLPTEKDSFSEYSMFVDKIFKK